MLEFFAGISVAFASLFGSGEPASAVTPFSDQPAAIVAPSAPLQTAAVLSANHGILYVPQRRAAAPLASAPASGNAAPTVQYITQPVIEREVLAQDAVSREELDIALATLRSELLTAVTSNLPASHALLSPAPGAAPVSTQVFAHSQRIDQLANVTISNATVSGVTGLTNADIPDDITASNYLPLSGGSLTFASSTLFSVFNGAYFGATATSSFDSTGALTLATPLLVSSGGTGANTFGQGWVYSSGGTGALAASTSPTVAYLTATSTSQASTFPYASTTALTASGTGYFGLGAFTSTAGTTTIASGQGFTVGGSQFVVQQGSGRVGIGTTSPSVQLHVYKSAANADARIETSSGTNVAKLSFSNQDRIFSAGVRGDLADGFSIYSESYGASRLFIDGTSAGNVGIGTTSPWRTLSVTGTVGFDGLTGSTGAGSLCLTANREVVYNSGSDSCLSSTRATKHDISPLVPDALAQVVALQPVSFIYNNDASSTVRYGFIAEDAAAVDSHLATYDAQGAISGIDDRSIISIVVKAIQELRSKVDGLIATVAGFADRITTKELCVGSTCVDEAQLQALLANTGSAASAGDPPASSGEEEDTPDTEAPVITINGNNPAQLQVGDSYADLGATVTDNVDVNLGYRIFVGETPIEQAHIDTSEPNEWNIHYVATDNAGNTATSTRIVIVESVSITPSDAPEESSGDEDESTAAFEPAPL